MSEIGQLRPRVDKLTACLGGCGAKLVKGYYFCSSCEPDGWDYRNPDIDLALTLSAKQAGKVREVDLPDWLRSKPRSDRQMKEALAYCREMGLEPPWLEKNEDPK